MPFTMPGKKRPLGGGSVPAADGAGSADAPAPAQSAPGYVNFSRLLAINQGGAQKMADNLASTVQQKGSEASNQIQGANQGFQQQVKAGTLNFQRPWAPSQNESAANLYAQAGALSENGKKGYSGPKDWAGAGYDTVGLKGAASDASQAAKNLTTAGGRGSLLRAQAGGPYSAGMSTLDSALSGAALGSRGRDLSALYGGLSQQLMDYQAAGGKAVEGATAASNAAAQQYATEAERYRDLAGRREASDASGVTLPSAPPAAPAPRAPVQYIGTTPVPVGSTPQTQPIPIPGGSGGTIQPTPPKKSGGQYIGGMWVPYT